MSLNLFKETLLRSCSQSFATSGESIAGDSGISTVSSNYIAGDSEIATASAQFPSISLYSLTDNLTLRKPPKSSLSKQLQRLDLAFSSSKENPSINPPKIKFEGVEEVEKEDSAVSLRFDLGERGPFVPLILSSPEESPVVQVFLISTRAGGLGLNLVSANRVVIFDPNWNPAQDLQAQDRSFRYGQKRHVVVFRLLAAGSLEELVYTRQIYKQQLSNIAVSGKMEKRYFEGVQDCKEFKGELFGICNLFRDLSDKLFTSEIVEMHAKQGKECDAGGSENFVKNEGKQETKLSLVDQEVDDASLSKKGNHDSCSDKYPKCFSENEQTLTDLGILYAHRNEDIVNMGPGYQMKQDSIPTDEQNTSKFFFKDNITVKSYSKEQKMNEFRRIAEYKGMELFDFCKWIISASSSELTYLLKVYQKNKRKRKLVS